jgi:Domain of unknown function (DUF4336)
MTQKSTAGLTTVKSPDWKWPFWFTLPLYPYSQRRTIRTEVISNTVWTFDQIQGVLYVIVPIRMTVVKLAGEGLLVYAPVAPTKECIGLVEELVAEHGEVKYIILPTVSGLEHKVFVGPFARRFPQAQVWVAADQWSFPIDLPLSWLGIPTHRTQILPVDSSKTPFGDEFDYTILGPIDLGTGRFGEVAFLHKSSRTLLVTDTVISIPPTPPTIVELDAYALLFHAKDSAIEPIVDTPLNRQKGWQRICLFALYFRPSVLEIPKWSQVFRDAFTASDRSKKGYFGLFPFQWRGDWYRSFEALYGNGRLFVAPILQALILNRAPDVTLSWANKIANWDFERIIPCHFTAPIACCPQQFRRAFDFLQGSGQSNILPEADFQVLREIDRELDRRGILPPTPKGRLL